MTIPLDSILCSISPWLSMSLAFRFVRSVTLSFKFPGLHPYQTYTITLVLPRCLRSRSHLTFSSVKEMRTTLPCGHCRTRIRQRVEDFQGIQTPRPRSHLWSFRQSCTNSKKPCLVSPIEHSYTTIPLTLFFGVTFVWNLVYK